MEKSACVWTTGALGRRLLKICKGAVEFASVWFGSMDMKSGFRHRICICKTHNDARETLTVCSSLRRTLD